RKNRTDHALVLRKSSLKTYKRQIAPLDQESSMQESNNRVAFSMSSGSASRGSPYQKVILSSASKKNPTSYLYKIKASSVTSRTTDRNPSFLSPSMKRT